MGQGARRWGSEEREAMVRLLCGACQRAGESTSEKAVKEAQGEVRAALAAFSLAGESELANAAQAAWIKELCPGIVEEKAQGRWAWVAKELLKAGASVDAVDAEGWTALHQQACIGPGPLAEMLIASGADASMLTPRGGLAEEFAREGGAQGCEGWADRLSALREARIIERSMRPSALWVVHLQLRSSDNAGEWSWTLAIELEAERAIKMAADAPETGAAQRHAQDEGPLPLGRSELSRCLFGTWRKGSEISLCSASALSLVRVACENGQGSSRACMGIQSVSAHLEKGSRQPTLEDARALAASLARQCGSESFAVWAASLESRAIAEAVDCGSYSAGWLPATPERASAAMAMAARALSALECGKIAAGVHAMGRKSKAKSL